MPLKPSADAIRAIMREPGFGLKLDSIREKRPGWLYGSDHVESAAAILNGGALLSRGTAKRRGLTVRHSACDHHIAEQRNHVRPHFRARAPVQHANGDIRSTSRTAGTCPEPISTLLGSCGGNRNATMGPRPPAYYRAKGNGPLTSTRGCPNRRPGGTWPPPQEKTRTGMLNGYGSRMQSRLSQVRCA